jgi:hypothetical protein
VVLSKDGTKGNRVFERVESVFNFLKNHEQQPVSASSPAPDPTPAPPQVLPAAAAAATSRSAEQKEVKDKKEKKSKKEKKDKKDKHAEKPKKDKSWRRSLQILGFSWQEEKEEPPVRARTESVVIQQPEKEKTGSQNRGSVIYTTADNKKIRANDLKKYPVTVCTYQEREQQLKEEAKVRRAQLSQSQTSPLVTLQELFDDPPAAATPDEPVSKGSFILNVKPAAAASSNPPEMARTSSMEVLVDAAASVSLTDETAQKGNVRKRS